MKIIANLCLFGLLAFTNLSGQVFATASFSNDYVLQERFEKSMTKAKNGIAKAQYLVGEMYEKGRGTNANIKQAFDWYQKAAEQRHLKAQFKMGYLRYKGIGVEKDVKKAFKHFKKPAAKGNVRAQYYLGKLYASGQGVIKDPKKALIWYSRASLGGYAPAEDELAIIKKLIDEIDNSKKSAGKTKKVVTVKTAKTKSKKKKFKTDMVKIDASKLNKIFDNILVGGWVNRKRPSEFLPSKLTTCEKTSSSIMECLSRKLMRNNGTVDIIYITKALLYDINDRGEFKVAYRNNVLEVIEHEQASDEDDEDDAGNNEDAEDTEDDEEAADSKPRKSTVKKGWQETEHQLVCTIKKQKSINCMKNKTRKLVYQRKT